jgi:aminoglycoside phosphotransferase (APT) family kinase protein
LACEFAALQHTVHRCRVPELHAVRPALRDAINRGDTLSPPVQEAVLRLLDSLPDDDTLCHGDFHPDNVILSPKGPVIIDWPNAARGCPLADVARTMVMLRFGHPVQQISLWLRLAMMLVRRLFIAEYLRSYFKQSPYTPQQLPLWEIVLAAHRLREHIPGEAEFLVNFVESRLRSLNLV